MTTPFPALRRRGRGPARILSPALVLVTTGLVGFLLVGQVRSTQRFSQGLEAESEADLARILASLNAEADALRDEIGALRLQLVSLQSSSESDAAATAAAEEQLRALEVLAGTVAVAGPGVVVEIADPQGEVRYDLLIDIVQELRDAGAEAIAVNGRRVGATSAFAEQEGRPTLDGDVLSSPYRVAAIGQPATLDSGLKIPGGAVDTASALKGVEVVVHRQARVELPALARAPSFDAARPVGSEP